MGMGSGKLEGGDCGAFSFWLVVFLECFFVACESHLDEVVEDSK